MIKTNTSKSTYSNIISATAPDDPLPAAPTNLAYRIENSQVILTWDNHNQGDVSYIVQRALSPTFQMQFVNRSGILQNTYIDRNVIIRRTYYYRVYVVQNGRQSVASQTLSVIIP